MGGYFLHENDVIQSMPAAQAFSARFPSRHRGKHINVKEMQAILQALSLWRSSLENCHINFHCDNFAVTEGLKKSFIRGKAMKSLRAIIMLIALLNVSIKCI